MALAPARDGSLNAYIDISAACDARCPFCIAETKGRRDSSGFFPGLSFALDYTRSHGGTAQIVGGEPTISKRLPKVLSEVARRKFHRSVLVTNGSGLNDSVCEMIADASITYVNVSRHHYDDALNQQIMRFRKPFSIGDGRLSPIKDRARLNCNLISGFIDSYEECMRMVEYAEALGVREVSFSQTFDTRMYDHNITPDATWVERHISVDLIELISILDARNTPVIDRTTMMSVWGGGRHTHSQEGTGHRRYWKIGGTTVSVKTQSPYGADGFPTLEQYVKATDPELGNLVTFLVVHPDGTVSASWDRSERVLFRADEMAPCS